MEKTKKRARTDASAPDGKPAPSNVASVKSSSSKPAGKLTPGIATKPGPDSIAYDSIAQAAAAMGVPKSVLRKLKRDGAPGFKGSRVYPAELQPWLEEKNGVGGGDAPLDRDGLECRRLLAQCKRIEHANQVESGDVIPLAPVLAAIFAIGEQLKAELLANEGELPPVYAGCSPEQIRVDMRKANDRICTRFFEGTSKIAKAA